MPIPAPVLLGEVYDVTFHCHLEEQGAQNTLTFNILGTTGAPTNQGLGDAMSTAVGMLYAPLMSALASYDGLALTLFPFGGPRKIPYKTTVGATAGTVAGAVLPRQVCGIYTKLTPAVGRGNRGRVYLPFPALSFQEALFDRPTAAYQGVQADYATFFTGTEIFTVGADTVTVGWLIRSKTGLKSINDFFIGQKWATHRSRGDFGAPNTVFG